MMHCDDEYAGVAEVRSECRPARSVVRGGGRGCWMPLRHTSAPIGSMGLISNRSGDDSLCNNKVWES